MHPHPSYSAAEAPLRRRRRSRGRPALRARRRRSWVALALLGLAVLLGASFLLGPASSFAFARSGSATYTGPRLVSATPVAHLSSAFLGANLIVRYPLNTSTTALLNLSGVQLVRWPGGALADGYNMTANRLYNDSGGYHTPRSSLLQFAAWCLSARCHAIVQVPAEIDNPSTAAYYVAYTESTLHFHPDYWEIGNEPAAWTHAGLPWSKWNTTQRLNATPGSYAKIVQSYAAAMKAVDPTIRLIGLPGVGTGASAEATWIRATVRLNGPNLSAVAIHVYPAGPGPGTGATLAGFFGTLHGAASLTTRVPTDRSAIAQACSTCATIALLVSEMNSVTGNGSYYNYAAGFPDVPYLSSEIAQAMNLNLSTAAMYTFEGAYPGAMLGAQGSPRTVLTLYAQLLSRVGPAVLPLSETQTSSGLYLVESEASTGGNLSLLVANTNTSSTLSLSLRSLGVPSSSTARAWTWTASSSAPKLTGSGTSATPSTWYLPPKSVNLITTGPGAVPTSSGSVPFAGTLKLSDGVGLPLLVSLLGLVAPTGLTFPCWATLVPEVGAPAAVRGSLPERLAAWLLSRL